MTARARRSGIARTLNAAGAAFVNGTAAHGEDFDDTFEGGPVHAGAVVVPAVLAACERHNPDGRMALIGIAVGTEVLCRLEPCRPEGRPQGRLSSDRGLRCDGRGGRGRCGARSQRKADRRCARHRRQHGGRHHRVSGGGRLDQAAACRLGRAIGLARGAACARRFCRAAHGVRGRPRPVSRLCAHHRKAITTR